MKRKILLFLITCLLLSPVFVWAKEPTDKFYMDITILENGDLKVKELVSLSGNYNGWKRTIEFANLGAQQFTGIESDFDGSSIYNGTAIVIDQVADVKIDSSFSFDSMNQLNRIYRKVTGSPNVAYQVYEENTNINGVDLKIYNPSQMKTAFYIEYTISDAVVVHEDVAELAWNLLGDSYQENIGSFEVRVHLPEEDSDYRVWLKGPLNGEVQRRDSKTAVATYNFLGAYNPVTIRMMFDKSLVPTATKYSRVNGKSFILASEKRAADQANAERKRLQEQNATFYRWLTIWGIFFIGSLVYFYFERKKNRKAHFNQDYYREFPAEYGPEVLEYLLEKNVGEDALSACILSLVEKKVLEVSEDKSKKTKDYIFTWNGQEDNLSEVEKEVIHLLIQEVGNGTSVTLSAFKRYGNSYSHANSFMKSYRHFISLSTKAGKKEEFFQPAPFSLVLVIIACLLGIYMVLYSFSLDFILIGIVLMILLILTFVIAITTKFYTEKGREDLAKWKALKHFLEDFSTFDKKELPEVPLWSKYLVYATVLGCAETLEKQMKVKIDEMQMDETFTYDTIFWNRMYLYHSVSHSVTQSVHSAVASSRSSISSSSSSSSGGFGGGASFGGGSFGGGGGGGRF